MFPLFNSAVYRLLRVSLPRLSPGLGYREAQAGSWEVTSQECGRQPTSKGSGQQVMDCGGLPEGRSGAGQSRFSGLVGQEASSRGLVWAQGMKQGIAQGNRDSS